MNRRDVNKLLIALFLFANGWSSSVANSVTTFSPVEITLRAGESYQILGITIQLLDARTKWTVSGDSALSVSMEVSDKNRKELVHLVSVGKITELKWESILINILDGDNGLVTLKISSRYVESGR